MKKNIRLNLLKVKAVVGDPAMAGPLFLLRMQN